VREFGRSLRVADFVRDELAQIMQRHMRDPRVGLVSVNDVTVSKDLSYAEIYVSSVDTSSAEERDELISVLNKAAGFFRSELAKRHSMRTTPKPRFHYDELVEKGPALEALIESAISEDASRRVESGRDDEQDDRV
jgi:ribosome-binding factor A